MNLRRDLPWRKPYRSGTGNDCVIIAETPSGMAVSDDKDPASPVLVVPFGDWAEYLLALRSGAPDHVSTGTVLVTGLPDGGATVRTATDGPVLTFTEAEWRAFVLDVRDRVFGDALPV